MPLKCPLSGNTGHRQKENGYRKRQPGGGTALGGCKFRLGHSKGQKRVSWRIMQLYLWAIAVEAKRQVGPRRLGINRPLSNHDHLRRAARLGGRVWSFQARRAEPTMSALGSKADMTLWCEWCPFYLQSAEAPALQLGLRVRLRCKGANQKQRTRHTPDVAQPAAVISKIALAALPRSNVAATQTDVAKCQ